METLSKLSRVILSVEAGNEQVCMGSRVLQIYSFSIILIALLYLEFGVFLYHFHLIYFFISSECSLDLHRLLSSIGSVSFSESLWTFVGVERVDFLITLYCSITYGNNYRSKSVIKWEVLTHILWATNGLLKAAILLFPLEILNR